MINAIIVHGKPLRERYYNPELPKPHDANWLPWIQKKLGERGVSAVTPQLPKPYFPIYEDWKNEFESHTLNEDDGLIGHSAGSDFILRWLSENKRVSLERVALVAPWHDDRGNYGDFSHYALDDSIGKRIGRLTVFSSFDDRGWIQAHARNIKKTIPQTNLIELDGFGHFMLENKMSTVEFPELLAELDEPI